MSSNPQHPDKKQGMEIQACNPSTGQARQSKDPWDSPASRPAHLWTPSLAKGIRKKKEKNGKTTKNSTPCWPLTSIRTHIHLCMHVHTPTHITHKEFRVGEYNQDTKCPYHKALCLWARALDSWDISETCPRGMCAQNPRELTPDSRRLRPEHCRASSYGSLLTMNRRQDWNQTRILNYLAPDTSGY